MDNYTKFMVHYIEFDVKVDGAWIDYIIIDVKKKTATSDHGSITLSDQEIQAILDILKKLKVIK